jgi:hypothetical protein
MERSTFCPTYRGAGPAVTCRSPWEEGPAATRLARALGRPPPTGSSKSLVTRSTRRRLWAVGEDSRRAMRDYNQWSATFTPWSAIHPMTKHCEVDSIRCVSLVEMDMKFEDVEFCCGPSR